MIPVRVSVLNGAAAGPSEIQALSHELELSAMSYFIRKHFKLMNTAANERKMGFRNHF